MTKELLQQIQNEMCEYIRDGKNIKELEKKYNIKITKITKNE